MVKKKLLNLGSGNRPGDNTKGWINIDIDKTCNPDIVRDLDKTLPFDDNSVDYVRASHVIEHVKDVFFFMKEIWRVSKTKREEDWDFLKRIHQPWQQEYDLPWRGRRSDHG